MEPKRQILLVDDVVQISSIALEYLERVLPDVQVMGITDPQEALDWLRATPRVDLILSDYRMDSMDGLEFLRGAREAHPKAVQALMSAYLDLPVSRQELGKQGVHALMRKPWAWVEFARFVKHLLDLSPETRLRIQLMGPLEFPEGTFDELEQHHRRAAREQTPGNAPAEAQAAAKRSSGITSVVRVSDEAPTEGRRVRCPHCDHVFSA